MLEPALRRETRLFWGLVGSAGFLLLLGRLLEKQDGPARLRAPDPRQ